jgi:hypothetical protein
MVLDCDSTKGQIKTMLLKACEVSTQQYRIVRDKRSMLPEIVVPAEERGKWLLLERKRYLAYTHSLNVISLRSAYRFRIQNNQIFNVSDLSAASPTAADPVNLELLSGSCSVDQG